MEPIVSPWLIYLLGFIDNLNILLVVIWVSCGIAIVGLSLHTWIDEGSEVSLSRFKKFLIIGGICLAIGLFVPSRNTLIGMIVARQITPNNISSAIKTGKDLKNELKKDVIEIIESVAKQNQKGEKK